MDPEYSESGAPIYNHELHQRPYELTPANRETHDRIRHHVGSHVGKITSVFQEMVSDLVQVDLQIVAPTNERDYFTVITTGMSDRPMQVPERCESFARAELLMCLPADWSVSEEAFRDECNYWPLRWLRLLARFPHEFQTWLFEGHTVPNQDPPKPFADNTELSSLLLTRPTLFGSEFPTLQVHPEQAVHFFTLVPLYEEEMEFKLKFGYEALLDRFADTGLPEVLDLSRPNACA